MPKKNRKTEEKPTKDPGTELLRAEQDALNLKLADAEQMLDRPYDFEEQKSLARTDWRDAQAHAEAAIYCTIKLGKRLKIMKDIEGHGKFADVRNFVGIDEYRAAEAMRIYREVGDAPALPMLAQAGSSKLLEVLRLPPDERAEVLDTGMLGGDEIQKLSVRELRDRVRDLKKKVEKGEEQIKGQEEEIIRLKRQPTLTDEEAQEKIREMHERLMDICLDMRELPHESLGEDALMDCRGLLESMTSWSVLLADLIDQRCGFFTRIQLPATPAEVSEATTRLNNVKMHFDSEEAKEA